MLASVKAGTDCGQSYLYQSCVRLQCGICTGAVTPTDLIWPDHAWALMLLSNKGKRFLNLSPVCNPGYQGM